jgi:hypothetical protein
MEHPLASQNQMRPPPPEGPAPARHPNVPPGARVPKVGEMVHFFPHRGHHPESYFAPHAGLVIKTSPGDPRIVNIYYFGPDGATGSYENIPHRSLTPGVEPVKNWLGHSMPPATHWEFMDAK